MPVRPRQRNLRHAPPQLFQVFNEVRAKKAHLKGIGELYNHEVEHLVRCGTSLAELDQNRVRHLLHAVEEILRLHKEIGVLEDKLDTLSCLYRYPLEPTLSESTKVYQKLARRDTHLIDEEPELSKPRPLNAKWLTKNVDFVEPIEDLKRVWRIRAGNRDGIALRLMASKVFCRTGQHWTMWLGATSLTNVTRTRLQIDSTKLAEIETVQKPLSNNPLKRSYVADDDSCPDRPAKRRKISHDRAWPEAYTPYDIFAGIPCNIQVRTDEDEALPVQRGETNEGHVTATTLQAEIENSVVTEPVKTQKRNLGKDPVVDGIDENRCRSRYSAEIYSHAAVSTRWRRRRSFRLATVRPLADRELNVGTMR